MSKPSDAAATQINNIQVRTGKTLDELREFVKRSGLEKHGELRTMFQAELGLGYGDANALVHAIRDSDGERAAKTQNLSQEEVLDAIYSGPKAHLREIHDRLMDQINTFGPFDVVPKKGYVSLRTRRQFAMVGPATNSAVEVGINIKNLADDTGWTAKPMGSMCNFTIRLTHTADVTDQIVAAVRSAYDA